MAMNDRSWKCICGRIAGKVNVSGTMTSICYCMSCTKYNLDIKANCPKFPLDMANGSENLVLYNSQIQILQGKELLVQRLMNIDSTNHRYSCKECGCGLFQLEKNSYIIQVKKCIIENQEGLPEPYRINGERRFFPTNFPFVNHGWPPAYSLEMNRKYYFGVQYGSPCVVDFEEPYIPDENLPPKKQSIRHHNDVPLSYTK